MVTRALNQNWSLLKAEICSTAQAQIHEASLTNNTNSMFNTVLGYVIKPHSIHHNFNFHNCSILHMKKWRFWDIKQWASRSLIFKVCFSLWASSWSLLCNVCLQCCPPAPPDLLNQNLHFQELPRWYVFKLKFEKHLLCQSDDKWKGP